MHAQMHSGTHILLTISCDSSHSRVLRCANFLMSTALSAWHGRAHPRKQILFAASLVFIIVATVELVYKPTNAESPLWIVSRKHTSLWTHPQMCWYRCESSLQTEWGAIRASFNERWIWLITVLVKNLVFFPPTLWYRTDCCFHRLRNVGNQCVCVNI